MMRRPLLVALCCCVLAPLSAQKPAASRSSFSMMTGSMGAITINRLYYGLNTQGLFGVDSTNAATRGGGFWPKGSVNQYMFNSGFQVSGIVAGAKSPSNPWGGDTTGAMFFDPKGTTEHGVGLTPLLNSASLIDVANWPTYARVPDGDAAAQFFAPTLRGRLGASEGDLWYLTWDGDPALNAGRPHPLGIAAEVRVLGWNFPVGNEDIIYAVVTYYNITSANAGDYASYRTGLREKLLEAGQKFQQLNNVRFGITLPPGGYTISPFYSGFAADPDVANAGDNFASANLPFAMGFAWDSKFNLPGPWTVDLRNSARPFFAGPGFVGMKYLRTGATAFPAIQLFSLTTGGGTFPDPSNTTRLFRYQAGNVGPDLGTSCNQGEPTISHLCYVRSDGGGDVRVTLSVPGTVLAPGASTTVVMAYLHAGPVAVSGYLPGQMVPPADPTRLTNATLLTVGANRIDSIAGFAGYSDRNGDGVVQPSEMTTIPRSLYGKAQLAQAVFDGKFLTPSAPDAPEFFLIPGDNKVTVVWKPSFTETTGDPYFELAKSPTTTQVGGGAPAPNPLYDPNFRKFDVEGYRIYRGRNESPASLTLVAQYDYYGTRFDDYDGWVPLGRECAPELGVTGSCDGVFDPAVPGVARVKKRSYDINWRLIQVRRGDRVRVQSGDVLELQADTTGGALSPRFADMYGTGVPFTYTDTEVRNSTGYFYAVTAFDYNSVQSGPSMMESVRAPKRVVPQVPAGNYSNSSSLQQGPFGRKGLLSDDVPPVLDAATGRFSKRAQPASGLSLSLPGFVSELFRNSGEASITLDSITLGQQVDGVEQEATHHYSVSTTDGVVRLAVPIATNLRGTTNNASGSFAALTADPGLVTQFGGAGAYPLRAGFFIAVPGAYYTTLRSRACVNQAPGFFGAGAVCFRNGPRWFVGNEETQNDPNIANAGTFNTGLPTTNFNNVGGLPPGVQILHEPVSYSDRPGIWRVVEGALAPFAGAADYRIYWGAGFVIDSVVDLTHDVQVPFSPRIGASWGVLNPGANAGQSFDQRTALTASDISCVAPLKTHALVQAELPCGGNPVPLSQSVFLGPTVINHAFNGNIEDRTAPAAALNGFGLYIKGHLFLLSISAQGGPTAGSQWTMRDYVGAIAGGFTGGQYSFSTQGTPRPLTAIGASAKLKFAIANALTSSTSASLAQVHTVPDPYYSSREFPEPPIRFIHVPAKATIRIYTSSGRLIRVLQQDSALFGGEVNWDLMTRDNKSVGNGVFFYHVTAENGTTRVGRMTIVRVVR